MHKNVCAVGSSTTAGCAAPPGARCIPWGEGADRTLVALREQRDDTIAAGIDPLRGVIQRGVSERAWRAWETAVAAYHAMRAGRCEARPKTARQCDERVAASLEAAFAVLAAHYSDVRRYEASQAARAAADARAAAAVASSPVAQARAAGRALAWNAPARSPAPTKTRGAHVAPSLSRDARRRDERAPQVPAGQTSDPALRGKVCAALARTERRGALPPRAMALPGVPSHAGATIEDGAGLAAWEHMHRAETSLAAARAALVDAEDTLDAVSVARAQGAATAPMLRSAEHRLVRALAAHDRAEHRAHAALSAWRLLWIERAEHRLDAELLPAHAVDACRVQPIAPPAGGGIRTARKGRKAPLPPPVTIVRR